MGVAAKKVNQNLPNSGIKDAGTGRNTCDENDYEKESET